MALAAFTRADKRADGDLSAFRHGVHGVKNQVDERFPNFILDAQNRRQIRCQFRRHFDHDAALLGDVAPFGIREVLDLAHQTVQIHRNQRQLRLSLTIEFPHPGNRLGHIFDRMLDGLEVTASAFTEIRLLLQ